LRIENLDFTEMCKEQSRLNMRTQKIITECDKENNCPNVNQCHDRCCIVGEEIIQEEEKEQKKIEKPKSNKKKIFQKKSIPPKLQNVRKWKTERKLNLDFD
jgi:hypothetical protein